LYLCLPPIWEPAGRDCHFPITCGTYMEKTRNKNLSKAGTLIQKHLPSFAQQGTSQSSKTHQGVGTPRKSRDIDNLT